MTTIYFVRHCEPNFNNHNDELRELTEKGLKDSNLVTNFLKDKSIDIVLSSPYKRSFDTVKNFADTLGYSIEKVNDFRERKIDSVWIEDFEIFCKNQWTDFNFKLKDGESLKEVQNRNISALKEVLKKYNGKNIVIGTHGTALSTIINYYDNTFGYECYQKYKSLMPWIAKLIFNNDKFISIEHFNLFD